MGLFAPEAIPHKINMVSFGYTHGYVRTDNNTLHSFGYLEPYKRTLDKVKPCPEPRRISASGVIPMDNVGSISQIICKLHYSFLIMDDGTVYARGLDREQEYRGEVVSFIQIKFRERRGLKAEVRIAKIIAKRSHIFYITTEGLCYYSYSCIIQSATPYIASCPNQIGALADRFVENVFVTDWGIVVQYDNNRLCRIYTTWLNWLGQTRCWIGMAYIYGTIELLAYPDGSKDEPNEESIVSATQASNGVYFTTVQGFVCRHDPRAKILCLKRVPFFDDNPIIKNSNAIRSGRSCLDD